MSQKVNDFFAKQQQALGNSPQLSYWVAFEELYNKKLWHQLTLKLLDYIHKEKPSNMLEIYENFLSDFETRIKQLSLVEISIFVVQQIENHTDKLKFIEKISGMFSPKFVYDC